MQGRREPVKRKVSEGDADTKRCRHHDKKNNEKAKATYIEIRFRRGDAERIGEGVWSLRRHRKRDRKSAKTREPLKKRIPGRREPVKKKVSESDTSGIKRRV